MGKEKVTRAERRRAEKEALKLLRSEWDKNTYAAREYGSAILTQLFGTATFSFAKSPFAVQDSLWVSRRNVRAGPTSDERFKDLLRRVGLP